MNLLQNIMQQSLSLKEVVNQVLLLARKYSNESEVSVIKTKGISISTRYGSIENVEFDSNELLKITVFLNYKKGTAFSNNLNKQSIIDTVQSAVNIARYTIEDEYNGIADKELLEFKPINLDLCHPIELDVKMGANLACIAEQTALKYDKRITYTEGGRFSSYFTTKVFGNSHDFLHGYSTSQHSLSCSVIAESNGIMEQNYAYTLSRLFNKLHSPDWVGQECARRTLLQLGSKKIQTMESAVLFMSDVAVTLFQHLSHAIHGNNVCRKSTFLLNDLENNIFPSWLSVKEFPHISQGIGSAPFDNEGVQILNRTIIKNGILKTWLLDTYSARKMRLKSTGHAGGIYNWSISHQNINNIELIKKMNRGIIITNLMGQGVNIMTGDYSRGISGFWVENGKIQYPVSEITISGNLKQMFLDIVAISNDIELRSNINCGSVLINSMQIAGI